MKNYGQRRTKYITSKIGIKWEKIERLLHNPKIHQIK